MMNLILKITSRGPKSKFTELSRTFNFGLLINLLYMLSEEKLSEILQSRGKVTCL